MGTTRLTFRDALRVREYRALWAAQAQSLIGDQLARVALSVLVFNRTGSPAITALVYALTFAPAVLGGVLLGGLADRLPRRSVMVVCDLLRGTLVALMAVPTVPLAAVVALLVGVVVLGSPFTAAEGAVLPDILDGELYVVGSGVRMMTHQLAQLVGFAAGGVVVAVIGVRPALLVDAATFLVSALVVRAALRDRPAAFNGQRRHLAGFGRPAVAAARLVAGDPRLRVLASLGWLAAFHVVPEGVAAPYANAVGGGPVAVGLLMAALPAGTVLGVFFFARLPAAQRDRLLGPLAVATGLPLVACAAKPGLAVSIVLWTIVGGLSAYQVHAVASFVRRLPAAQRGQTIGLVSSILIALQGFGILAFGALASRITVDTALACAGIAATVVAAPLAATWGREMRHESRIPAEDVGSG